jgi:hypothetical protein
MATHVVSALDFASANSRALAASFKECAKTSGEAFFTKSADDELTIARGLNEISARITEKLYR